MVEKLSEICEKHAYSGHFLANPNCQFVHQSQHSCRLKKYYRTDYFRGHASCSVRSQLTGTRSRQFSLLVHVKMIEAPASQTVALRNLSVLRRWISAGVLISAREVTDNTRWITNHHREVWHRLSDDRTSAHHGTTANRYARQYYRPSPDRSSGFNGGY